MAFSLLAAFLTLSHTTLLSDSTTLQSGLHYIAFRFAALLSSCSTPHHATHHNHTKHNHTKPQHTTITPHRTTPPHHNHTAPHRTTTTTPHHITAHHIHNHNHHHIVPSAAPKSQRSRDDRCIKSAAAQPRSIATSAGGDLRSGLSRCGRRRSARLVSNQRRV